MEKQKRQKWIMCILWLLLFSYTIACAYLFYMQSIQPLDYNNRYYQSDLPYHISMIVEDGWYYSFTAYIYQALYLLAGRRTGLIAAFLAAVTAGCVLFTKRLLQVLLDRTKADPITLGGALALNVVMPFFWRMAGVYRYVSYQSGNIWHNSTYQCMKLVALAAFLYYVKIEKEYREKLECKDWVVFALLLVLCTGIKPSFLTVFAPALLGKLLWDLCHGVRFRQIFLLGSTVLPACGVILWQNAVLFGEDTGQGFTVSPWFTFSLHADRPKLAVLCSIAFPLVVLLCSLKELFRDRQYFFVWMMTGIGFLEALLLAETGSRANDGNFLWGYSFCIFLLFAVSFSKWLKLWKQDTHRAICQAAFIACGAVFAYQLFCGVYFWIRLMMGETYFMV